jgi:TldD protein
VIGLFDLLQYAIKKSEELGADFVEARFDDFSLREILVEKKVVKDVKTLHRRGIGVYSYYQGTTGYSFTVDLSKKSVAEAAARSVNIAKGSSRMTQMKVEPGEMAPSKSKELRLKVKKHPRDFSLDFKKDLVLRAAESSEEYGESISSITGRYGELYGEKLFANSVGTEVSWSPIVLDIRIRVVSKRADLLVDGADGFGGSFGLEAFDVEEHAPETLGENAGKWAAEKLKAKPAPPGKHRALCENLLVGVLAHESFGHLTEADFVVSGMSPLTGKLGEQLGSENATIIDEGTPDPEKYNGFWIPFDDQGVETTKVVIMENGRLLRYLHSKETATLLKDKPTGNARAINYNFPPIVRMRNTYFAPGDLSLEEALELLDTGIYAIRTAGGQANADGTFMFKALRGYYVERGEIKHPLREVTLTGSILTFLRNVEGATKELIIKSGYFGGCGKGEQWPLPVGLGGPHLLVREVQFGGEKE